MVTIVKTNYETTDKSGKYFIGDLAGKSTDTKPTEIEDMKVGNGCTYIEVDTGDIYIYDLENEEWTKF